MTRSDPESPIDAGSPESPSDGLHCNLTRLLACADLVESVADACNVDRLISTQIYTVASAMRSFVREADAQLVRLLEVRE